MNPELLMFPSSLADCEAVSMAPLSRRRSCFLDDVPRSENLEGDLASMRRKQNIIFLRLLSFSTYSSNLEDFNGHPSTWGTPWIFCRGLPLRGWLEQPVRVREGPRAAWLSYVLACIPPGFLRWKSRSEACNGSSSMIPMGDLPGNVARLPVSVVYDEYQKAKARKRRPSYTPPPRIARAALSANAMSSTSSTSAEVAPNRDPLVDAHRRLIGEVFLLRSQVQDMVARRDLLV
ncbi:hypothetical protein Bca52824_087139 [Brassica carinata]|uniref:Uncharacterized protein n=1 Tax=Brassica carinata TaxID=52824 RepID=A0A8X7P948_BRACI|nr:hypothetical protein Bca52824_087139 [Brassica carinata]